MTDFHQMNAFVLEIASKWGKSWPFVSGKGTAGRVRFSGFGTNAEKDRNSGNWRYTVAGGKAKWEFPLRTGRYKGRFADEDAHTYFYPVDGCCTRVAAATPFCRPPTSTHNNLFAPQR